ncbi:hypothetical protein GBO17_18050 [Mycobacterium avium subsp. hominissuis]|nr:hypothetical protein [Mycobacterium avium subsp. hominissuis]MBZ4570363.1 hypothetical protein [Mycobacterium avium subsp. hominissuis]MBZ4589082.1 hypothetical protein [Mycobacterium avium subsp. hominissuis]MBZ4627219.1 hypothetical protein [Mycobacterium avium subsp. hominissuis]
MRGARDRVVGAEGTGSGGDERQQTTHGAPVCRTSNAGTDWRAGVSSPGSDAWSTLRSIRYPSRRRRRDPSRAGPFATFVAG